MKKGAGGGGMAAAALDAESLGGDECLEEDEEELETGLEDPESVGKLTPGGRGCCILTRRGITLRVLLKDGLIEPGEGVLSIYYLGKKFLGDLLTDGKIVWQETGQVFNSPSAWATYCKKLVNPAKKSGCGWASVKYKGQKLDQYKAIWLKKYQPHASVAEESLVSEGEEEEFAEEEEEEAKGVKSMPPDSVLAKKLEERTRKQQCKNLPELHSTDNVKRLDNRNRVPVRYCNLGSRDSARNPHTLVEVTSFAALNKFQPFNVAISSNVLLLLDFHSHLTKSEVVGYLGGRWDINSQLLTVLRAFPCRSRLGDIELAAVVEEEICQNLFMRGLSLVGWYHSHPFSHPLPSLQDIDTQMDYQLKLQGTNNSFQPCLALICTKALRLRHPYGSGSHLCPRWIFNQRRPPRDDAAGGVLQRSPRFGEVSGNVESGTDVLGQA
ncbi:MPN domain-containing protein isoform X2 [Hemicordylus capensis]|uniref:MPN domain-containing protein isoform X2 n=1 Tax=Hemicordylus capensis TaxID=884348 RepID=UPI0023040C8B|nr:MPN domain-containing protein isoform X2 [Hemicordylus capensis]